MSPLFRIAGVFLLTVPVALIGCVSDRAVSNAIGKYGARDYAGALVDLQDLEGRSLTDQGQVRYLVYRGLAHYRVFERGGRAEDRDAARRFLTAGRDAYKRGDEGFLSVREEEELRSVLQALGERVDESRAGVGASQHAPERDPGGSRRPDEPTP